MSNWRKGFVAVGLGCCCILASGCWSSYSIEDRYLEAGIAFDAITPKEAEQSREEKKEYYPKKGVIRRTVQFILPNAGAKSSSEAQSKKFYNHEETGDSVMEMTRESFMSNPSPAGFHLKSLIISSKLLRELPLHELIDFYLADNDIRLSLELFTTTGTASDIFEETIPGEIPAYLVKEIAGNRKRSSRKVDSVSLAKVIGPLKSGTSFVLPNVLAHKSGIKVAGAGVIQGKTQKYAGYLNESEVEGLQWIKGEIAGATVKQGGVSLKQLFVYEIKSAKSDIKVTLEEGQPVFSVKVVTTGRYAESFIPRTDKMNKAEHEEKSGLVEKKIKELMEATIVKLQKMGTDVAGFRDALRIQHPHQWDRLKPDWDETFQHVKVTYSVKASIEDSGASTMTVK